MNIDIMNIYMWPKVTATCDFLRLVRYLEKHMRAFLETLYVCKNNSTGHAFS